MFTFFKNVEQSLREISESLRKIANKRCDGDSTIVIDASDLTYREIKTLMKAVRHDRLRFETRNKPKAVDPKTVSCWNKLVTEIEALKRP
jgi:hypothetical protein